MPRIVFNDKNISRGKNFEKVCNFLFPKASREKIGAILGGVPGNTIKNWELGGTIANRALVELQRRGVSLLWLLASEGPIFAEVPTLNEAKIPDAMPPRLPPVIEIPDPKGKDFVYDGVEMPVRGLAAADDSGGTRVPNTDDIDEPIQLPSGLTGVPVIGESMSPVVLGGQYVVIDSEREGFEVNDGIYVVSILEPNFDDDYPEPIVGTFVKRCERHENLYYLKSVNTFSPFSAHVDHCRVWPVLGTWFADKGKPPEGF